MSTVSGTTVNDPNLGRRRLPIWFFIVLVAGWVAVIKIAGAVADDHNNVVDGRILTSDQVFWSFIVPLGAASVYVFLLITVFGFWRPYFHDTHPVRRWVWIIPIVFIVGIAGGINYSGLADRGGKFTLMLIAGMLLVGFNEEGMFRCIGVTAFRQNGFSEGKVALWTSVIFGLAHIANIVGGDARALAQAVIVSFAGYFFYLIRRVSRGNILNTILHGGFDFMIISGTQIIPEGTDPHPGVGLAILVYLVCGIVVLVQRHKIEPVASPQLAVS